ncbi:MAG: hypothetical protein IPH06_04060 [Alphaproteobacteria bacterium]|nr:hypothetical protein [Alphaproteobacteria bacterium]QQS57207.1 MAG: hypothetical protein IPN28_13375 [Alphaproteobacteria bacterium]
MAPTEENFDVAAFMDRVRAAQQDRGVLLRGEARIAPEAREQISAAVGIQFEQ